jgi:hypothetical protein
LISIISYLEESPQTEYPLEEDMNFELKPDFHGRLLDVMELLIHHPMHPWVDSIFQSYWGSSRLTKPCIAAFPPVWLAFIPREDRNCPICSKNYGTDAKNTKAEIAIKPPCCKKLIGCDCLQTWFDQNPDVVGTPLSSNISKRPRELTRP